jgi:uncharacterized protein YkwD
MRSLYVLSGMMLLMFGSMLSAQEVSHASLETIVFQKVNAVRQQQGLPVLKYNDDLAALALAHTKEMAAKGKLNHDGFSGRFSAARERIQGLSALGENVAMNFPQDDVVSDTVKNWMASPIHRANILRSNTLTGVGVWRADNGDYYFTQLFGH